MIQITVIRAVFGFAMMGGLGVILALVSQGSGMEFLDRRLEARDHRRFKRDGGWPKLNDFPVVGDPGWEDKVHAMRRRRR